MMAFMKPKKRQKLCHNCEGEADLDVIVCPFCAADLSAERSEQKEAPANHFSNQNLSHSLYPPGPGEREAVEETAAVISEKEEESGESFYRMAGVIALFAAGIQLFLFSALLLLFSHEGILVLKWSSRFWFLYFFASIPLLFFGYRSVMKL